MSELPKYRDKRAEFFKNYYASALSYEPYVATGNPEHQLRWKQMREKISLTSEQVQRLSTFKRHMPILVMSGTWCGDCIRQGPMFDALQQKCPLLEFKYIDSKQNPELQEELRINGAEKVPVVVCFSEDFFEVGRFGDRHLSVYQRKLATELGAACDAGILGPPKNEVEKEIDEWIDFIESKQIMLRLAPALRNRYND